MPIHSYGRVNGAEAANGSGMVMERQVGVTRAQDRVVLTVWC